MCNKVSFRLVAAMTEEVGSSYTHIHTYDARVRSRL